MKKTVLVAFGGASPEHEVSVLSAHQAIAALKDSEWNIKPLYIAKSAFAKGDAPKKITVEIKEIK